MFIDTDVPVLLGQEGFFDRYRIEFEQDHDTFKITTAPRHLRDVSGSLQAMKQMAPGL